VSLRKYLANVLSGRIKHRSETNGPVIAETWAKAEIFDPPFDIIFAQFIVSAEVVVETLVGPEGKSEKLLLTDPRKFDQHNFRCLYSALLAYFVFLSSTSTPFLKGALQWYLLQLQTAPNVGTRLLDSLNTMDPRHSTLTSAQVWDTVVDLGGFGSKESPSQLVFFSMTALSAYLAAVKAIKPKVDFDIM